MTGKLFRAVAPWLVLLSSAAVLEGGEGTKAAKVTADLRALYEAHAARGTTGGDLAFTARRPMLPVANDRVVVDAVASGDVEALARDLRALGARNVVARGRIASGQLPVGAGCRASPASGSRAPPTRAGEGRSP